MLRSMAVLATLVFVVGCGTTSARVAVGPSNPGLVASQPRTATPAPYSEIGGGQETLPAAVLSPATVLPAVGLCDAMYGNLTADGGYLPLLCTDGSLNDRAWSHYAIFAPHLLVAGPGATVAIVDSALQADAAKGASRPEVYRAYVVAAAYYGWSFNPDPACAYLYSHAGCSEVLAKYSTAQASVAAKTLPPATVSPVARLCSADLTETADGNWEPRFCADGSINVVAWREYAQFSPHILAAGRGATVAQIDAALKADRGPTLVEELDSYLLARAYYGWHFSPDPACEYLYKQAACY